MIASDDRNFVPTHPSCQREVAHWIGWHEVGGMFAQIGGVVAELGDCLEPSRFVDGMGPRKCRHFSKGKDL